MDLVPTDPRPFEPPAASSFRATVHGLAFAGRSSYLAGLASGDRLLLIPDPPGSRPEQVWVHREGGDPLGHLPDEIGRWLAPWMRAGGRARGRALRVGDRSTPSWKRLLVRVDCRVPGEADRVAP
jgi:hypothetical protein